MTPWHHTRTWIASLAASAQRRHSTFDGGLLQWHIWGSGPPLLLLHGGSGSWTHWCRNIAVLSTHYQVLVPDLPGKGDSDAPPFAFDSMPVYDATHRLAEIISAGWRQIATQEQQRSFHIMGFSLGSIVGTVVATIERDSVAQLTVVGTSALGLPFEGIGGKLRPVNEQSADALQIADQQYNLGLIMMADKKKIDEASGWIQLHNVKRARLRTHTLARSDVMLRALPNVSADTDIVAIWGSKDIYAQPNVDQAAARLRQLTPAADIHVIDGGGHWVMYECAEAFNNLIDTAAQ